MIFPDQSHINHVREALWKWPEGRASVFIGAGVSRNAQKTGSHAKELPLWHEITKLLCEKLYPPKDSENLELAMSEAAGSNGFLRLAQEYESAFGKLIIPKKAIPFG